MEGKETQILEKVKRLYHRYGIKSVTMDDVANHLGISKKTIYEFFQDKEDLVRHVLLQEQEQSNVIFEEIFKKNLNAIEELFEVYKMINELFQEYNTSMEYDIRKYYPDIYTWIKQIKRKRMYSAMYNNMIKGKREGLYRKDLNASIIARLHIARTENLMNNDVFSMEELTSLKVFREIFIYHLKGVLSQKGMEFFEAKSEKIKTSKK